jgi:hypothetical protein
MLAGAVNAPGAMVRMVMAFGGKGRRGQNRCQGDRNDDLRFRRHTLILLLMPPTDGNRLLPPNHSNTGLDNSAPQLNGGCAHETNLDEKRISRFRMNRSRFRMIRYVKLAPAETLGGSNGDRTAARNSRRMVLGR